jgi:hypothetical protein
MYVRTGSGGKYLELEERKWDKDKRKMHMRIS